MCELGIAGFWGKCSGDVDDVCYKFARLMRKAKVADLLRVMNAPLVVERMKERVNVL